MGKKLIDNDTKIKRWVAMPTMVEMNDIIIILFITDPN